MKKQYELCRSLKIDEGLQFVNSEIITTEKNATTAVFTYQLNGNLDQTIAKMTTPLISGGWKFKAGDNFELENGYRTISFKSMNNYQKLEIRCRQKEISFGIYD